MVESLEGTASPDLCPPHSEIFFIVVEVLDGFWWPVHVRGGERGRPEHVPTDENRQKIAICLALGWTQKRIADERGISLKTLRKHYSPQLKARDVALDRLKVERLSVIVDQARGGNVGALKELGKVIDAVEAATFGMGPAAGEQRELREPRVNLGKKEQAQLAAADAGAGTEWGEDLQPPLLN